MFLCYEENQKDQKKIMKIKTTVGQLNFFKWAIENNIISYIRQHIKDIEESMRSYVRLQREEKRKLKATVSTSAKLLPEDAVKSKTRRRQLEQTNKKNGQVASDLKTTTGNKTLRKGTIVTNRTHTTVFFS